MAHYCSRHKMDLPIENFTVTGNHITDCCNACLEKDCVQLEAQHAKCATVLVDTLMSAISFNELCSELAVQKEKEHITHSIQFNSKKPIDICLSDPGNNIEELDPTTENGNKEFKSRANSLAEKLWQLLGYHWQCIYYIFDLP